MTSTPTISVVIVTWNARDGLAQCLRSLGNQIDSSFETLVVDNGSSDGTVEMVRREFPLAKLIETGANLGFAEGCNRGIEASEADWLLMLNNDALAEPSLIEVLRARAAAAGDQDGMLQARILFTQKPDRTNSTGMLLFRNGDARDRDFDRPRSQSEQPDEIFCPTAGAALYRRTMLEQLKLSTGYFDRTFFMYAEDLDLGWRSRLAGWRAHYVPEAIVYHAFQGSSRRHGNRFVEVQCTKNRFRTLLKNASAGFLLRSCLTSLRDALRLIVWQGLRVIPRAARAVADGMQLRAQVTARARVDRRAVERAWAVSKRMARGR